VIEQASAIAALVDCTDPLLNTRGNPRSSMITRRLRVSYCGWSGPSEGRDERPDGSGDG
jgi:hypothetical protein